MTETLKKLTKLREPGRVLVLPAVPTAAQVGSTGEHLQVQIGDGYTSFTSAMWALTKVERAQVGVDLAIYAEARKAGATPVVESMSGSDTKYMPLSIVTVEGSPIVRLETQSGITLATLLVDPTMGALVPAQHQPGAEGWHGSQSHGAGHDDAGDDDDDGDDDPDGDGDSDDDE